MGASLSIHSVNRTVIKVYQFLDETTNEEVLGIRSYFNFTTTYVPAEHRQNTGYIFLEKKYIYVYSLK
jgi:hypothetical protein